MTDFWGKIYSSIADRIQLGRSMWASANFENYNHRHLVVVVVPLLVFPSMKLWIIQYVWLKCPNTYEFIWCIQHFCLDGCPSQVSVVILAFSFFFCNNGLIICCFLFYRLQCDMLIFSVYLVDQGKYKFTSLIKEK